MTVDPRHARWPVVLVSMPFMAVDRPSIQLGLLKAIGEAHGFPVRTLHANLDLAERVGVDRYADLAAQRRPQVGDWLFSVAAFGADAPDPAAALLTDFAGEFTAEQRKSLRHLRDHEVPAFLDELVEGFPWSDYRVVGFSCTFQQNAASFALARRIKRRHPGIRTVFGGANFDGEMGPELVRSIDCVDAAVIGEGDAAFPALLHAWATGGDPAAVPGVALRAGAEVVVAPPAPPVEHLDDLPVPDYDEYFERRRPATAPVWLPFESARGCWWGAKHHCTFCGLNATAMRFRAKSPGRVLDELARQARRYRGFRFEAVDNIMDMAYLTELFPAIADSGADYEFFYEVKANLTRAQLRLLALGGATRLQPGLESLSSNVLRLMNKGTRAAQNVNLLRWARYYGIDVTWNVLWGFRGETAEDYAEQVAAVPHLVHLQPPASTGRVWVERFSPMYAGCPDPVPERSYRYVYPSGVDLDRVAYFFEDDRTDALPEHTYDPLRAAVAAWTDAWRTGAGPVLTYRRSPGHVQLYDGRHEGREGTYTFDDPLAAIYLACTDRPTTAAAVGARTGVPVDAVEAAFDSFAERGLLFRDGTLAVALALPAVPGR